MNIDQLRVKYPQYNDLSDMELANAFYEKYYNDVDKNEYYRILFPTIAEKKEADTEKLNFADSTGIMIPEVDSTTIDYYNVSGRDPRHDSSNWVQDQCSKNLSGCLLRFAETVNGLPYRGFPGTERFPYG